MNGFRPITKRPTITGDIVEQLLAKIRTNELKPGDVLPTEKALSEQFFVGRNTIREAIRTLEATGLIQIVKRRKVVCSSPENGHLLPGLTITAANIHDVFEIRRIMEVEIAGLAAERAGGEDIIRIREAMVSRNRRENTIASDIAFHLAIADAAKNVALSQIYQIITGILFQVHKTHVLWREESERKDYLAHSRAEHRRILKAVESHRMSIAKKAMRQHLLGVEERLNKLIQKEGGGTVQ